jgi:hypothetical protein
VNERIRNANRIAVSGPPVNLVTYDVDELIASWRAAHPAAAAMPSPDDEPEPPPARPRRWHRTNR